MQEEKQFTSEESLALITDMINKAKAGYHNNGTGPLLWGSAVSVAAFVSYLQAQFNFSIGFDIWLIVFAAIIPQVIISVKTARKKKFKSYDDVALDAVWITYAITIFGLVAYQNIVPGVSLKLNQQEGFVLLKHFTAGAHADEQVKPFTLSITSIYILIYAFPTLVTGLIKNFRPMIAGAVITYVLFVVSCFTSFKYDMLLSCFAAIACWLIPGIILRKSCRKMATQNQQHV